MCNLLKLCFLFHMVCNITFFGVIIAIQSIVNTSVDIFWDRILAWYHRLF